MFFVLPDFRVFGSFDIFRILLSKILWNRLLSSLMKLFSFSLVLIIVCHLPWMNFSLIMISTVREVWLKRLYKLGRIIYISNSSELTQRNIKSITKLDLLELSVYLVGTWLIDVNQSRLLVISLSISVCTEWWG